MQGAACARMLTCGAARAPCAAAWPACRCCTQSAAGAGSPSIIATSMPAACSVAMPAAATRGLGSPAPTTTWRVGAIEVKQVRWAGQTQAQARFQACCGLPACCPPQAACWACCACCARWRRRAAHPLDARLHKCLAAGRRAAVVVAGLQRHIRGCALRRLAWGFEEPGAKGGGSEHSSMQACMRPVVLDPTCWSESVACRRVCKAAPRLTRAAQRKDLCVGLARLWVVALAHNLCMEQC